MTTPTTTGTWTLALRAPAPFISMNDRLNRYMKAEYTARWRAAAFVGAARAKLPKGLGRVRVQPVLHFPDRRSRDAANYHLTLKAATDGIGPPFLRLPSVRSKGAAAPGYGLIANDDAAHLDLREPFIGDPYMDVAKGLGLSLASQWGALVLTITDISPEVPDAQ